MCCIGPEYLSAEAAPFDPSHMPAIFFFILLCDLLDVGIGGGHLLSVSGSPLFPVQIGYLLRHALANSNPSYPSLKLRMEDDGAVMHTKVHRYPFELPAVVFIQFASFINLIGGQFVPGVICVVHSAWLLIIESNVDLDPSFAIRCVLRFKVSIQMLVVFKESRGYALIDL
jgi:hypothetical protein